MKKSRVLTLQTLVEEGACKNHVELFTKMFGESVEVTETLCLSVCNEFNFWWAVEHLLSPKAQKKYNKTIEPASKKYKEILNLAWEKYYETRIKELKKYNETIDLAQEKRNKTRIEAWEKHNETVVLTFARCYINDK